MKIKNQSMLEGPLFPSIIRYTTPIILTSLLSLAFNAADMIVVGRFCGSISVASVGATGSLNNLLINFFIGLSTGCGVTVAHAIGAGEEQAVSKTVHTAIPTALICGVILTITGIFFSEDLLILMGTPENLLPLSALYMKIYFCGVFFSMVYNFCAAILRAAGDTKSPLLFLFISGIVNVVLNLVFVIVFHMDVAGVALATAISSALSAVLVVIALMRRTDACKLYLNKLRIYKEQILKILRIGLPAGINSSLFAISNVLIQSSVNSFGDILVTGNSAAGSIEGFVYVCMNAYAQTSVNFVGQNHGAHQYNRVIKSMLTCLACVTLTGITLSIITYSFAPQLLSLYITDSPDAIAYGVLRMGYVCLPYFLCGIMDVTTSALRGIGASVTPMFISVLGVCGIRIGWLMTLFQLPQFHTPDGLYVSYPISWFITFLIEFIVFLFIFKKRKRQNS